MKNIKLALAGAVYFGLISVIFTAMPQAASAALTESQIQAILSLLQSFGADQTVVGNVNSSLRGLPTTGGGGGTIAFCPNFTYNLYLGLNDSETEAQVSQLQKFLAQDSSVYPEGTITGFYGPLTEQAVKRWQAQQGVVSSGSPDTTGYGVVGSRTREKIRANCGFPTPVPPTPIPPRSSNLSPVISGVSGPTTLNTGQSGTWTVTARDPENGPLSYNVVWGDEASFSVMEFRMPSASEQDKQTATFTHTYFNEGVYTPIFYVTDDHESSAKTSISVNVGGTVISQGSLYLSPNDLSIRAGQSAEIRAFYQPPMPSCPPGFACIQVMPAAYPVSAKWVSSNPAIASVSSKDSTTEIITGVSAGSAEIKAIYTESSGNVLTATAKVNVISTQTPSITVVSPNGGERWVQGQSYDTVWSAPSNYYIGIFASPISGAADISISNGYAQISPPFRWGVPSTIATGDYKIKIQIAKTDADGRLQFVAEDKSDSAFSIVSAVTPSITVLSPNGGESWQIGTIQTIRWSAPSSSSYVSISLIGYSKPCTTEPCPLYAVQSFTLGKAPASGGYFNWTVGKDINGYAIPSGQYLLQITDTTTNASDQSNAPFSIVAQKTGDVAVDIKANGSDGPITIQEGDTLTITWTSANATNCGSGGSGDTSYYNWGALTRPLNGSLVITNTKIGSNSKNEFLLDCVDNNRVQAEGVNQSNRKSDTVWVTIIPKVAPSITVLSPNVGEMWNTGDYTTQTPIYYVQWKMPSDQIYNVELYLIPQGSTPVKSTPPAPGSSDVMIDPVVGGYGIGGQTLNYLSSQSSYAWVINPKYPAGTYKVRAYLMSKDATYFDSSKVLAKGESDAPFSIVEAPALSASLGSTNVDAVSAADQIIAKIQLTNPSSSSVMLNTLATKWNSNQTVSGALSNIRVMDAGGATIGGPISGFSLPVTNYNFVAGLNYTVPASSSREIQIRAETTPRVVSLIINFDWLSLRSDGSGRASGFPMIYTVPTFVLAPSSSGLANVFEAVKPLWWPTGF